MFYTRCYVALIIMVEFKGQCKGVRLEKRGDGDNHIKVVLLTEDDENWFDGDSFSSSWIDEMIEKLQEAKRYIETQEPDIYNGRQYGYRFSNAT